MRQPGDNLELFTDVKVEGDVITGKFLIPIDLSWWYGCPPAARVDLDPVPWEAFILPNAIRPPAELPIVVDDSIPPDTIELRSPSGRLLGAIINIGWDPGEPPAWTTEEIPE